MVRKSKSVRRSRRRSGNRKYKSRGGAVLPSEYFGKNSGNYSANAGAACPSAYGVTKATSHGVILPGNVTGPNLGPGPRASGSQTGGKRRRSRRSPRRSRRSKRRSRRSRRRSRRSRRRSRRSRRRSRRSRRRSRRSRRPKKKLFFGLF